MRHILSGKLSILAIAFTGLLLSGPIENYLSGTESGSAYADTAAKKKKAKINKQVKKAGLAVLPDGQDVLKASKKKKTSSASLGVLGTPPALVDIPGSSIKDLFWNEGVVDAISGGSPNQNQCSEFYSGSIDGQSGGFGACHMAESVGHAFQSILEAGSSLCYMKNFPAQANVDSGGVTVDSGELPDNDITKLFAPPTGEARVVLAHVSGFSEGEEGPSDQDVFIKVHPSAAGTLYKAELWFCQEGVVTGSDNITITSSGKFLAVNNSFRDGDFPENFHSEVEAALDITGNTLTFDATKSRSASVTSEREEGSFKSELEIKPNNEIYVKQYDLFGGSPRKGHVVTKFTGSGPGTIRFIEGAFREVHEGPDSGFSGGTEFRGDRYVAAPDTALSRKIKSNQDIEQDDFYNSAPNVDMDLSAYSCATTPDVEITMDMSNSILQAAVSECENRPFQGMHFCHDDEEVGEADSSYSSVCSGGHDEG